LPGVGSEMAFHIHTHVREDMLALYGFLQATEKQLFEKLISVSGIGPKLAITILSGIPDTAQMIAAIRTGDHGRLTHVPGIGKKTAERLVLELRDKLPSVDVAEAPLTAASPVEEDVLSALGNLGYRAAEAERALAQVRKSGKAMGFDGLFREALALLSK